MTAPDPGAQAPATDTPGKEPGDAITTERLERLLDDLLTDGTGVPARRLVLEQGVKLKGPGWSREALRGRILLHLYKIEP